MALFTGHTITPDSALGGIQIQRSLRFNSADSEYIVRSPTVEGNRKKWTWSGWSKRARLGRYSYALLTSQNDGDGGGNNGVSSIYFGSDDKIHVYYDTTGSNASGASPAFPTASGSISLVSFTVHKAGAVGVNTELLTGASVSFS